MAAYSVCFVTIVEPFSRNYKVTKKQTEEETLVDRYIAANTEN